MSNAQIKPQNVPAPTPLKLLTANLQAGITTRRYVDYLTRSWGHAVHLGKHNTLSQVAQTLKTADIVGIQESDSGSLRSGFNHQTHHLAQNAELPYWHHQDNRRLGRLACSGNGLLARVAPTDVELLTLPGKIKGRGGLLARFGLEGSQDTVVVGVVHLSLGPADRKYQLDLLAERLSEEAHAILMGDFNCTLGAPEMAGLWRHTHIQLPPVVPATFPSWKPVKAIDHILTTDTLNATDAEVLAPVGSDHLMVSRTVYLPYPLAK